MKKQEFTAKDLEELTKIYVPQEYASLLQSKVPLEFATKFHRFHESPLVILARHFRKGGSLVGLGEVHSSRTHHRLARETIHYLRVFAGLEFVCIEFEENYQQSIDNYLLTGDRKYLEQLLEYTRELVKKRIPVQGRIDHNYFSILDEARALKIPVIALDAPDAGRYPRKLVDSRDTHMVSRIPTRGKGLFYVGEIHLEIMGKLLKKQRGTSKVHLMVQNTEHPRPGMGGKFIRHSLAPMKYTHPVAIDFRKHRSISNLLGKSHLTSQLPKAFDSLVYHP